MLDFPALGAVVVLSLVLMRSTRESAVLNVIMVVIHMVLILFVMCAGACVCDSNETKDDEEMDRVVIPQHALAVHDVCGGGGRGQRGRGWACLSAARALWGKCDVSRAPGVLELKSASLCRCTPP
eukprot:scaffold133199_cov18-Tisochrysis_lutea.AAC.1